MVWIHRWSEETYLLFTDGYLPAREELRSRLPRSPPRYRTIAPEFESLEQRTAWTLSALARRLAWYRGYDIDELPLETTVIGTPKAPSARLASWFWGDDAEKQYRVMVHRSPRLYKGRCFRESLWQYAHQRLKISGRAHVAAGLRNAAEEFLDELLNAYREG